MASGSDDSAVAASPTRPKSDTSNGSSIAPPLPLLTSTPSIVCCECGEQVDSCEALKMHITVGHLQWVPFECVHCQLHLPTYFTLVEHAARRHADKPLRILFDMDAAKDSALIALTQRSLQAARVASPLNAMLFARMASVAPPTGDTPPPPPPPTANFTTSTPMPAAQWPRLATCRVCQTDVGTDQLASHVFDMHAVGAVDETALMYKCFGKRKQKRRSSAANKTECRLCRKVMRTGYTLLIHVIAKHSNRGVSCSACEFTSLYQASYVKAHILKEHPANTASVIDRRFDKTEQLRALFEQCFPDEPLPTRLRSSTSSQPENGTPRKERSKRRPARTTVYCKICERSVSMKDRRDHVLVHHVKQAAFRCRLCAFEHACKPGVVRSHLLVEHPAVDPEKNIINMRSSLETKISDCQKQCFDCDNM